MMMNQTNSHQGHCFRHARLLHPPSVLSPGNSPGPQVHQDLPPRTIKGSSDRLFVCVDEGEQSQWTRAGSIEYSSGGQSFSLRGISGHAFSNMTGKSGSRFGLGHSVALGASNHRVEAEDFGNMSGTHASFSVNASSERTSTNGPAMSFSFTKSIRESNSLATIHEPERIHPRAAGPMQLGYILNSNEGSGSGSSVSSPLSTLSSIQEMPSNLTSPAVSACPGPEQKQADSVIISGPPSPPQLDDKESGNGTTRPRTPQEVKTSTPVAAPASAAATTVEQPQSTVTRTQFEPVTAHTAKCDLCNARNDSGMSRCSSCGWQSCHACTIKNGCARTHNAGSRVHTGPIDCSQLVSSNASPKGKKTKKKDQKGSAAQQKGSSESKVRKGPERRFQRGRGRGKESSQLSRTQPQRERKARTPSPSSDATVSPPPCFDDSQTFPANDDPPSPSTEIEMAEEETEKYLEGARDLYAFSIEAYGAWVHEEREKNPSKRWCYQAYGLGNLHGYAQDLAARAVEEHKRMVGVLGPQSELF